MPGHRFTATRKMQHVGGKEDQAGSGPSVFKLIVVVGIEKMTLKPSLHHRFMSRKGRLGTGSMVAERAVRGGNETSHWGIKRRTKRVMGTLLRLQIFVLELLAVIDKRVILLWCLVTKMEAIYQGQEVWLGVSMQCS